jgi:outer membrane protein assembly factor BamB
MNKLSDLLFVGFNGRVVALNKFSGERAWDWASKAAPLGPVGSIALLVDGERLFVSIFGYTYCLDALTGEERWTNPLEGMGVGAATLACARA